MEVARFHISNIGKQGLGDERLEEGRILCWEESGAWQCGAAKVERGFQKDGTLAEDEVACVTDQI